MLVAILIAVQFATVGILLSRKRSPNQQWADECKRAEARRVAFLAGEIRLY